MEYIPTKKTTGAAKIDIPIIIQNQGLFFMTPPLFRGHYYDYDKVLYLFFGCCASGFADALERGKRMSRIMALSVVVMGIAAVPVSIDKIRGSVVFRPIPPGES